MAKASAQKVPPDNTVAMQSHALGTLQYIRASIEAAGSFAVPGSAGIAMGAIGLAAALSTTVPGLAAHWFAVWLIAGAAACASGSALMLHQARAVRGALYRGPARKFALCLCPALFAGGVLTWALWQSGAQHLIPGTWLLLYGCGVTAAGTMTVRPVVVMGALFIALGVIALQAPAALSNILLGAGFGGLHLIFGMLIRRMNHGQ